MAVHTAETKKVEHECYCKEICYVTRPSDTDRLKIWGIKKTPTAEPRGTHDAAAPERPAIPHPRLRNG